MNKKVAIIAANGGLFDAYKVFNIATAAAATDAQVAIFFTFEGLNLIHKDMHKQLPLPQGKEQLQEGFEKANVPSIETLVEMVREMGVRLIVCQMTMDVIGLEKQHFVEGIEVGGAATFLDFAFDADVTLSF
ncbi:sulfur reduction protein DsrE [Paenibacillus sp. LMG 31456]|uniref:Sulfur reduction protein DsrE n=1 Tax=Paenibacillus foliorum TaxID=2654974 RepID=A0A972JZV9_9BACL|nr:DsrE/DsrF/DrsH-like family protein [Paenibacillus foliorum]NOU93190.1 sulfur reduction protein DsrE [Paenibacillus foliorum]